MQKRFSFSDGAVELYAEKVMNRGLCAVAQAESLRYKLLGGLAVRRFGHHLLTRVDAWSGMIYCLVGLFICVFEDYCPPS